MSVPPDNDDLLQQTRAHERHLRSAVARRRAECGDAELGRLLGFIAERRARRGAALGAASGRPEPAAPVPADPPQAVAPGTITSVEDVAPGVRILRVARPPGFSFRAGQHVKLSAAGAKKARPYTIASAPADAELEFCIELVPGGMLTPTLFALRPGDRVELGGGAKGSFLLDRRARVHLMVATVTGIAPLRSMLRAAPADGAEFVVLHGASYADELPYREELEALAGEVGRMRYIPTVSRPGESRNRGWSGRTGRVDDLALEIAGQLGDPAGVRVYACGNPGMVDTVRRQLGDRGFEVATEAFS